MTQRMIFFPHKRRTSLRGVSVVTTLIILTVLVFLAGVRVGAQRAAYLDRTGPVPTIDLASARY